MAGAGRCGGEGNIRNGDRGTGGGKHYETVQEGRLSLGPPADNRGGFEAGRGGGNGALATAQQVESTTSSGTYGASGALATGAEDRTKGAGGERDKGGRGRGSWVLWCLCFL